MLLNGNDKVETCRQKAAEARELGKAAPDLPLKEAYATIERSWSILADSISRAGHTPTAPADPPLQEDREQASLI